MIKANSSNPYGFNAAFDKASAPFTPEAIATQIANAVELLEAHGWTCTPPDAEPDPE